MAEHVNVRAYPFYPYTGQDPIIMQIKRMMDALNVDIPEASRISGVAQITLHAWFSGKTRTPQHKTVQALTRALQIHGGELRMPQTRPDYAMIANAVQLWYKSADRNLQKPIDLSRRRKGR